MKKLISLILITSLLTSVSFAKIAESDDLTDTNHESIQIAAEQHVDILNLDRELLGTDDEQLSKEELKKKYRMKLAIIGELKEQIGSARSRRNATGVIAGIVEIGGLFLLLRGIADARSGGFMNFGPYIAFVGGATMTVGIIPSIIAIISNSKISKLEKELDQEEAIAELILNEL